MVSDNVRRTYTLIFLQITTTEADPLRTSTSSLVTDTLPRSVVALAHADQVASLLWRWIPYQRDHHQRRPLLGGQPHLPSGKKAEKYARLHDASSQDKIAAQNRRGHRCPRVENRDEWGSLSRVMCGKAYMWASPHIATSEGQQVPRPLSARFGMTRF